MSDAQIAELCAASEARLCAGSCVLARPEVAALVQEALLHFEGVRYALRSWSIMPNHVHVIFTTGARFALSDILHSWKSFTSNEINRLLGLRGALWERESFNHLIRSDWDLGRFVRYVEQNA